jgi:DNA-binding transcriptional MerR regulator
MSDKSPDAFRTISEVADWLGVQPHVLRFWESKFSQVKPVKRAGGRRYYRPNDMLLLGGIRKLLHEDGLTIKGAQKVLREEGVAHVAGLSQPLDAESAALVDTASRLEPGTPAGGALTIEPDRPEPDALPERAEPAATGSEPGPNAAPRPELSGKPHARPEPAEDPEPDSGPETPRVPEPETSAPDQPQQTPETPPLPSFVRHPAAKPPLAPKPKEAAAGDPLPSFLRPPAPTEPQTAAPRAADTAREAELPLDHPVPPAAARPDASDGPRPKIVDAPDPDEAAFDVSAGALSAALSTVSISLKQRMAAGRGR